MDDGDGYLIDEEILVPISAIEHYSYCPRQCALIHVEQTYDENLFTIKGKLAHERVDEADNTTRGDVRVLRSIPLWSERLGLQGRADVVELRPEGPYPVEYKVGRRHGIHPDLQVCAQALCLEEMMGLEVKRGAIFYHAARRRHEVVFDEILRERTVEIIQAIKEVLRTQRLPAAPNDARCKNCSLIYACMPTVIGEPARLRGLQGSLFHPMSLEIDYQSGDVKGYPASELGEDGIEVVEDD